MLESIKEIVVLAAREEIVPRFNKVGHDFKADGSLITEADLATQSRIQSALRQSFPDVAFLGEEMPEAEQVAMLEKHSEKGIWCLDPLDGTSNFAAGIPYFAVSLALIRDRQVQMGLVYDPMRDECFYAEQRKGAFLNGRPLRKNENAVSLKKAVAIVDFKRLSPELAARLAVHQPYASQRSFGSVALDWCWLAARRGHVYLHGKQRIWDYAAGNLVFQEAGGSSSTLAGEPVFEASMRPRAVIGALDNALFGEWTEWIKQEKN